METTWLAQEVAQIVGSVTTGNWVATSVAKDSRELKSGALFIALKGPKADGNDYALAAFEAGAVGAIVERIPDGFENDSRFILVKDTLKAINDLAIAARARTIAKIIAITGSFGKTGVKDATQLLLSAFGSVYASERSFNNHWGVPFTLSNIPPTANFGIIEIGMNHAGEIAPLSSITRPHIAVITIIREMHLENLGSLENIADEKAEIFAGMDEGGIAVLNHDDKMFARVLAVAKAKNLRIITFGNHPDSDCRLVKYALEENEFCITVKMDDKLFTYRLPNVGEHWILNSLAVLGVIKALGLDPIQASKKFSSLVLPEGRGMQHRVCMEDGEFTVIDESYNAGPDSMRAALKVLGSSMTKGQGRKIAVLGDMRELGTKAQQIHESLKKDLMDNQIDLVFACGEQMQHLYRMIPKEMRGAHTLKTEDLIPAVVACVKPGDVLMIKGSKGQYAHRGHMHAFVEALLRLNRGASMGVV